VGAVQGETPVDKVITLLGKLRDQVQEEGKGEAASYDRFACFCKDHADSKAYAIRKSDARINELEASIEELGGRISQLDTEVNDRQGDVTTERKQAAAAQKVRSEEVATYQAKRADLADAVAAVENAITALQSSKEGVENAKAAAALLATQEIVTKMAAWRQNQAPVSYKYQSNDVIATLQGLLKTFKKELADLDTEEGTTRHGFDMSEGARANKISAYEHEIDQKQETSAHLGQQKADNQNMLDEETSARNADQAFLDDLTATCEEKAKAWDERSKTRAAEITAITEALATLNGMGDVYNANSKLVGLVSEKRTVAEGGHWVWVNDDAQETPSLIQLRRVSHGSALPVVRFLERRAHALRSTVLARLASKLGIESAGDHFAKVRQIIKDLIKRLEEEASSEADQKSLCDKEMKAALDKRDKLSGDIESFKASIDETKAVIQQLTGEIAELAKEIAEHHKAINEMTELRATEKAQNEKTIADADEGETAVRQALLVLQKFYASGALVQQGFVPKKSDREGNTVGDLAPETFEGEYKGKVDSSKGIIGMLEVIADDFARTVTTTEAAETDAKAAFTKAKGDAEDAIKSKEGDKGTKETDKETKSADLVSMEDDLKDSEKLHGDALEELEKLKPACVDAAESWEERKHRRQQEIESLKEALRILEDWKN